MPHPNVKLGSNPPFWRSDKKGAPKIGFLYGHEVARYLPTFATGYIDNNPFFQSPLPQPSLTGHGGLLPAPR